MTTTLNLLIIGCGRIGKMHVDNVLQNFPHVHIQAIIDDHLDTDWAKTRHLNVLPKTAFAETLQDQSIQAVLIAASSAEHVDLITQSAKAGKHIFCEKPISFDVELLDEIDTLTKQQGVKLQVGLNRRFDPEFVRAKAVLDSGEIGEPHIIKITNRDPLRPELNFIPRSGGLFLDFNIHDLDMLRFISGAEITEVYAMGANLIDPKIGKLGDLDTTIISVKLSNGALCAIDSSRETHYGYDQRLEIFGSKGKATVHNTRPTSTHALTEQGTSSGKLHWSFVERYAEAYRQQLADFFHALETDGAVPVGYQEIKQAVLAALAAQQSFENNQPITL